MKITDVSWIRDGHSRQVLALKLDEHPFHARSSQEPGLIERGIVKGLVFLESERFRQLPNRYIQGSYEPAFEARDLVGCTDDPGVFALYQTMCEAIRTDRWKIGAQPTLL